MKDLIYYYDKNTFEKHELGEVQKGFKVAFTLDGTKDSAKFLVLGYIEHAIEPNTIIYHSSTDTWWVVSHDKVEQYKSENGYLYKHSLQLEGAIELLNARDLTDCGYYQNRYTIQTLLNRLFSLSTFEFKDTILIDTNNNKNLNINQKVDYIKSFENYTLLSALREFFDGYNCAIKLSFIETSGYITNAKLHIVPKSGDTSKVSFTLSTNNPFNDVRVIRNMDKNSFGNVVVSNANNVVSSMAKTYPTIGTARLTGTSETITPSSARLRLPSTIFKLNWLKLCYKLKTTLTIDIAGGSTYTFDIEYQNGNDYFNEMQWTSAILQVVLISSITQSEKEAISTYLENHKEDVFSVLKLATSITLYNCDRFDPYSKNWVAPKEPKEFYFPYITKQKVGEGISYQGRLVLTPKEIYDSVPTNRKAGVIAWERGKDYIEDFHFLSPYNDAFDTTKISSYSSTDLRSDRYDDNGRIVETTIVQQNTIDVYVTLQRVNTKEFRDSNTNFIVNYIPMSDMKVKYDNNGLGADINLYNQNGKLNDSNAFSKLLLSHSKEIASENITKYGTYHNLGSQYLPQIGAIIVENNVEYVINNVSLDYYQNEKETGIGYFVVGEFTLSRNVATKSLLTSPNTNIRDYGIPQNYNVKRKQLYRDYYELSHETQSGANVDTPYLTIDKVWNVGLEPKEYVSHIGVIKVDYAEPTGGDNGSVLPSTEWYYQLESTTFTLKKQIYEIIDFKDNNIIGYSPLNTTSGFDITKFFQGFNSLANTPVQYTDDLGEVKGINIAFCTDLQLTQIYDNYLTYHNQSGTNVYNASVFIDSEIYNGVIGQFSGAKNICDFEIVEENYYKDSIEVPVFEYSCQIEDSDDVIIGENIFNQNPSDVGYLYQLQYMSKNTINNASWYSAFDSGDLAIYKGDGTQEYNIDVPVNNTYGNNNNSCKVEIELIDNEYCICITPYQYNTINYDSQSGSRTYNYVNKENWNDGLFGIRDIVIVRVPINNDIKLSGTTSYANIEQINPELFMVVKHTENANIDSNGRMIIKTNYYKTK